MFTKDYYILVFDLTSNREADEDYVSLPGQGNVRIEADLESHSLKELMALYMLNYHASLKLILPKSYSGIILSRLTRFS